MSTANIARIRELVEQVGSARAAGLVDEMGDPELCELADLIRDLDKAGALAEPLTEVTVVEVEDRTDGIYVFADAEDAMTFDEAVNGSCYRRSEMVITHKDAHVVIDDEREED